jgi:U4/U6 small nuclear ribonucleoprotein PRP4
MEGHIKQVLALDFSPDGYHVVTGSDDHQAKVRGVGMFYHI